MSEGDASGSSRISRDDDGPELVSLDQSRALRHLLKRLLRVRFLTNRLMDSRTFSSVAAAAPGVKDLVYLSYLADMAGGADRDVIVVDGFASGHSVSLLTAPGRVVELVRVGPAARLAREALALIEAGGQLTAVVVSTPEELCLSETESLVDSLHDLNVPIAPIVVNGVYPARLDADQAAWLRTTRASTDAMLHLYRRERQLELSRALEIRGEATFVVPYLFEGHRLDHRLADRLLATVMGAAAP
jgi:anion-transporting  ArsA/GET3 family ATPase